VMGCCGSDRTSDEEPVERGQKKHVKKVDEMRPPDDHDREGRCVGANRAGERAGE
jgi:hypothetical protein